MNEIILYNIPNIVNLTVQLNVLAIGLKRQMPISLSHKRRNLYKKNTSTSMFPDQFFLRFVCWFHEKEETVSKLFATL
jgi:hypothetical protein